MIPLLLALAPHAHAFCGAYVGAEGEELNNYSSEVVMARTGNVTTLTLISDYSGDATEFAMLLPIPEVIGPEDVDVVDPVLLEWIADYSMPREVAYSCDTAFSTTQMGWGCGGSLAPVAGSGLGTALGCSNSSLSYGGQSGAEVEAAWSEAGYDFVVLSAEESSGLLDWLDFNGYAVPLGGEAILQEYVDGGAYFLAARVSLNDAPREGDWLWPIQISYESDVFSLPIRIGTISSTGIQDVVIYALTDAELDGTVAISNYPRLEMPEECLLPEDKSMGDWYEERLSQAHAEGGAGWVQEYSWKLAPVVSGGYHCDPCTAEPVAPSGSFEPFGFDSQSAHLTRLRMRYTTEEATQDLQLYITGITDGEEQLKFISPNTELESLFPYCDTGWAEDPGTCPDAPMVSCGTPSSRGSAGVLLASFALLRRRRR